MNKPYSKLSQSYFKIEITELDDSESMNDTGRRWSVNIYDLNDNLISANLSLYNKLQKTMQDVGQDLEDFILEGGNNAKDNA